MPRYDVRGTERDFGFGVVCEIEEKRVLETQRNAFAVLGEK